MKPLATLSLSLFVAGPAAAIDCATTEDCRQVGLCTERDGRCLAGSDGDCIQSGICQSIGFCVARSGDCYPNSPDDCRQSRMCRFRGRCSWSEHSSDCIPTDATCAASEACALDGRCHARGDPVEGVPVDVDDCGRSGA